MSVTVNKTRLPGSVIKTASGAVASVSDARMRGAIGVEASFSPKQDLHGYANPWLAGGGKNICPPLTDGWVDGYIGGGGVINAPSPVRKEMSSDFIPVTAGATYTLNYICDSGGDTQWNALAMYSEDKTFLRRSSGTANIPSYYTPASDVRYVRVTLRTFGNASNLQLELGSSATSYAPYENLCPISGITSASAWADPQYAVLVDWNQLFPAAEDWYAQSAQSNVVVDDDGVITATIIYGDPSVYAPAIRTATYPAVIANHIYYFACKFKPATDGYPYVRNNSGVTVNAFGVQTTPGGTWGNYERIVGATGDADLYYFGQGGNTSQIQIGDSISFKDLVCVDLTRVYGAGNEPLTVYEFRSRFPKDYYEYNPGEMMTISAVNGDPHSVTVQLGEERYGGSYDFVRGKLTLTKKYAVLNDASLWRSRTGTVDFEYNYEYKDRKLYSDSFTGVICSFAPVVYGSGTYARWIGASQYYFGIKSTDITIAQIQNYAENGDLAICYELATPIVIDMTPAEFVLFYRQNYVWSDVGDTKLTYAAIHEHGG